CKVHCDMAAMHRNSYGNRNERLTYAVIIKRIGELVATIRDSFNRCLCDALSVRHERIKVLLKLSESPTIDQFLHAAGSSAIGGNLGCQVPAPFIWGAYIAKEQRE